MFVHTERVRFRDLDPMGHVNNAVYFTYLEQCRLLFWREVTGAASPKDMGRVMKAAMARLAGQTVDGKTVNELVRKKLASS